MSYFLYALYTLLYFLLLIWGLRLWLAASRLSTALLLAVTFGVFYDNLILALGNVIGASALLWGRHDAWPWITLAVLLAFFGEIIPDEAWRRAVGSAFELLLMAVLFLTQQRLDRCGVLTQRSHIAHPQRR
ncbi:MAG: hypothetical protein IPM07_21520 [Anaerolineales bacterium]|nr:hypothetical protein [Anaerolineales bacterium]